MMRLLFKKQICMVVGCMQSKLNKGKMNMNELTCKTCDDVTIMCDEGVVSVTCGKCVMVDVEVCNG